MEHIVAYLSDHEHHRIYVHHHLAHMKQLSRLLIWAGTICLGLQAYAQGRVNFSARVVGLYDAPVFDVDGVTKVSGPDFLAQMYAGPNEGSLAPIDIALPFRTGPAAGYWSSRAVSIPSVPPGQVAYIQIHAWAASAGPTFEEAVRSGGKRGVSRLITTLTGGEGSPPSLPTDLAGLESFGMIVETQSITAPPGFSLISNPLFRGSNTVVEILPNVPEGTILYRFDNFKKTYSVNSFDFAKWSAPTETLKPGEGAFLFNPTDAPLNLQFTGEVGPMEKITVRIPGFYLVSCGALQACHIEQFLGFPPHEEDIFYRFTGGQYVSSKFMLGTWIGEPPVMHVGESAFVKLAAP